MLETPQLLIALSLKHSEDYIRNWLTHVILSQTCNIFDVCFSKIAYS